MERRGVLKAIGLISFASMAGMFSACTEKEQKETKENKLEKNDLTVESVENKLIINRQKMAIQDSENPTKAELKHTPEITIKESDENGFTRVDITVGSQGIIHPVAADHWIDYIKLYVDEDFIGEIKNEAGKTRGFGSFYVKLENVKSVRAEIGCNLHGIWENTLSL